MIVGIPRETAPGEHRVAIIPPQVAALVKKDVQVVLEKGAGVAAGFPDSAFEGAGAQVTDRSGVFDQARVLFMVQAHGANPEGGADLERLSAEQVVIGFCDPLSEPRAAQELAGKGVASFSMEFVPRITRAQSMDALSSMGTIAGYKSVLLAAVRFGRLFPMLMTAAGTLAPAKVFVNGVGVAGLQAIATARRLGGVVEAYDIRPAVKDEVTSVGAKFVELELETADAEGSGGYAKAQDESFYQRQRDLMTQVIARNDIVITTAAVPGRKAPILITADMVRGMEPGSVIVDLAAERGGNCELTEPGQEVMENGVIILGPLNVPASVPTHASQMYSKNIFTFFDHLFDEGQIQFDLEDEITNSTLVTRGGEVVHPAVRDALGFSSPEAAIGSDA